MPYWTRKRDPKPKSEVGHLLPWPATVASALFHLEAAVDGPTPRAQLAVRLLVSAMPRSCRIVAAAEGAQARPLRVRPGDRRRILLCHAEPIGDPPVQRVRGMADRSPGRDARWSKNWPSLCRSWPAITWASSSGSPTHSAMWAPYKVWRKGGWPVCAFFSKLQALTNWRCRRRTACQGRVACRRRGQRSGSRARTSP